MERVTSSILFLTCLSLLTQAVAQGANSNKNGQASAQNNREADQPARDFNNLNKVDTNTSLEGGFTPITRFYPNSSPNPNNFYYSGQNQNHHQGQGYYQPDHNHVHPYFGYPAPSGGHPSPSGYYGKGIQYPLPLGYYPPTFGTPSTTKPYPSTSPYNPVPTNLMGGNTASYYPPTMQVVQYPYSQNHYQGPPTFPAGASNDGFDVGSLPQQVRVPGDIKINIVGKDAEITCEFPKYLILIQGIFWHHKYNDPFGTYYDTQNGYGTRVTVKTIDQWRSVLYIQDYSVDDFGTYRCISAAVLPAEIEATPQAIHPIMFATRTSTDSPESLGNNRQNENLPLGSESPPIYEFDSGESKSNEEILISTATKTRKPPNGRYFKNSRKMKFPPMTKLRFARQTDEEDQVPPASDSSHSPNRKSDDSSYDPFFTSENHVVPRSNYLPQNGYYSDNYHPYDPVAHNYRHLTNPYTHPGFNPLSAYHPNSHENFQGPTPIVQPNHLYHQTDRHLPQFGPYYPGGLGFGSTTTPHSASQNPTTSFGLQVPYYKPSYSFFTVYQEVTFQPSGVAGRHPIPSSSPYPYLGK